MKFFFKKNFFYFNLKTIKTTDQIIVKQLNFLIWFLDRKANYFFFNKNNFNFFNQFLHLILNKGKKKKLKICLSKTFNYFFYTVSNDSLLLNNYFSNLNLIKYNFSKENNTLYILNIIIKVLIHNLYSTFNIGFKKVNKRELPKVPKSKKLNKKINKYTLIPEYVFPENRKNLALKWLHFYSSSFNDYNFSVRLFKAFIFTYTEGNDSFLFKKKLAIYNYYIDSSKKKSKF